MYPTSLNPSLPLIIGYPALAHIPRIRIQEQAAKLISIHVGCVSLYTLIDEIPIDVNWEVYFAE